MRHKTFMDFNDFNIKHLKQKNKFEYRNRKELRK